MRDGLAGVDVVADALALGKHFDAGTVDVIAAQDILEHFDHADGITFLKSCFELLAPGGRLEIRCPDIDKVWGRKDVPDEVKVMFLYGGQDHAGNYHKWGYTQESLRRALTVAGFKDYYVWPRTSRDAVNMLAEARK